MIDFLGQMTDGMSLQAASLVWVQCTRPTRPPAQLRTVLRAVALRLKPRRRSLPVHRLAWRDQRSLRGHRLAWMVLLQSALQRRLWGE